MSWRLMVADPVIHNHSFNIPTRLVSVFDSAASATDTDFDVTATDWGDFCKKGDYVIVGPSSANGYAGKVESFQIESAGGGGSSKIVDLIGAAALVNDYSAGDLVTIVGTNIAGGWKLTGGSEMVGRGIHSLISDKEDLGYDIDTFRQRLIKTSTSAAGQYRMTLTDWMRPDTYYRFILFYEYDEVASDMKLFLSQGGVTPTIFNLSTGEVKAVGLDTTAGSRGSTLPEFIFTSSITNIFTFLDIDLLVCGHAAYTSNAANGCVVFPNNPTNPPSARYRKRIKTKSSKGINNDVYAQHLTGYKNNQIEISCILDGTATFIQDLEVLKFWMDQGKKIILEHDMSSGGSTSIRDAIPPVLYGSFEYSINYSGHWNLDKSVINFKFVGE